MRLIKQIRFWWIDLGLFLFHFVMRFLCSRFVNVVYLPSIRKVFISWEARGNFGIEIVGKMVVIWRFVFWILVLHIWNIRFLIFIDWFSWRILLSFINLILIRVFSVVLVRTCVDDMRSFMIFRKINWTHGKNSFWYAINFLSEFLLFLLNSA